jgi:hypothetical protein
MKKQLTNDKLLEELKSSAFFRGRVSPAAEKPVLRKPVKEVKEEHSLPQSLGTPEIQAPEEVTTREDVKQARDTTVSRHHDTMTPRYHDTTVEAIRRAVKQIGKEAATHRFTVAEKQEIANIVFSYKNKGLYTSENEISRVAINFIIEDYKENGEESVLVRALKALND